LFSRFEGGGQLFLKLRELLREGRVSQGSCTHTEKNGFVTATKLGTRNKIFVAPTENFAAATKRFVDRTKHFVVTKYFYYPYFNK